MNEVPPIKRSPTDERLTEILRRAFIRYDCDGIDVARGYLRAHVVPIGLEICTQCGQQCSEKECCCTASCIEGHAGEVDDEA